MSRPIKQVETLAQYWERERKFASRLGLIDGREILSLDAPTAPEVATPAPPRTAQWEYERMHLAAGMLPPSLKRYQRVLWAIYYHAPRRKRIIKACRLSPRHYRRVRRALLRFFIPQRAYFQQLNRALK